MLLVLIDTVAFALPLIPLTLPSPDEPTFVNEEVGKYGFSALNMPRSIR